jgi:tRNA A37 threonylcarbamoyladenosine dehydratase
MSKYERQLDLIKPEELAFPIHVIGCGGIGSWTTLMLAKMGCQDITVYDDDLVEEHNVASQFFNEKDLGELKREALCNSVLKQSGVTIKTSANNNEQLINNGLVIFAVDSMEERIKLGGMLKNKNIFLIDGRMGGLQLEIYCREINNYEETLCEPLNVSQDSCTGKSIGFNCATIGSWIANMVRLYSKRRLTERDIIFDFENITLFTENPVRSQI